MAKDQFEMPFKDEYDSRLTDYTCCVLMTRRSHRTWQIRIDYYLGIALLGSGATSSPTMRALLSAVFFAVLASTLVIASMATNAIFSAFYIFNANTSKNLGSEGSLDRVWPDWSSGSYAKDEVGGEWRMFFTGCDLWTYYIILDGTD